MNGTGAVSGGASTRSSGVGSNAFGAGAAGRRLQHCRGTGAFAAGSATGYTDATTGLGVTNDDKTSGAIAIGYDSNVQGDGAVAIGRNALANGSPAGDLINGTAVGTGSVAWGTDAVAYGHAAVAAWTNDQAMGANAWAGGGFGTRNMAIGNGATAGNPNDGDTDGTQPNLDISDTVAIGAASLANANQAMAVGVSASATGLQSQAFGNNAIAAGMQSLSNGFYADAEGDYSTAMGSGAYAAGVGDVAIGSGAVTMGANGYGTALGYGAFVSAQNAVALGANSVADRDNAVSVGSVGAERQIINVATGTQDTDAANVGQLKAATALAVNYDAADKGNLTLAGTSGTVIHNVAAGTDATDAVNVSQLNTAVVTATTQATALAVNYDAADKANLSLGGANGTIIHNVHSGISSTDAANVGQLVGLGGNVDLALGGGETW